MGATNEQLASTGLPHNSVLDGIRDCITGIDHVAIAVERLEDAIDWYTQKLGFRMIERRITHGKRTSMLSAVLTAGGAVVVLIQGTSPDSQVSRFIEEFGTGVQHVAFSVTDLDVAMERVSSAGGALDTPMIVDDGIRQAFLRRDSGSGVRVELIERRGGDFSDGSVEELFRAFEYKGLY
jgi:methylmalonyl-CoA/ethylmalonyl-CoA epimerase